MERRRFVAGALGAVSGIAVAGGTGMAWAAPDPGPARRAAGWSAVPSPGSAPGAQLYKVAALDSGSAWAVGEEGRTSDKRGRPLAMRWDGTAWAKAELAGAEFAGGLRSVAAASPDDVWAVGSAEAGAGRLLRRDGTSWRNVSYPGSDNPATELWAVATGPGGQVWVAGLHAGAARLLHWDGGRWKWLDPLPVESPEYAQLVSVTVAADGEVWVTGSRSDPGAWFGIVARWDGAWTVLPDAGGLRSGIYAALPLAGDDIWAVGLAYGAGGPPGKPPGAVLVHWDGAEWKSAAKDIGPGALTGIAADAQGRPAWICGWEFWDQTRSAYLRWDGSAWQLVRGTPGDQAPKPYMSGLARVPGTDTYLSVGRTGATEYPPSEAYGETTTGP